MLKNTSKKELWTSLRRNFGTVYKNKNVIIIFTLGLLVVTPLVAHAIALQGIITTLLTLFTMLIGFLVTLGLIYFLWGVAKYISSGSDAASHDEGRQMMINGIIALFVMVSVWGLVNVLAETFSLTGVSGAPPKPEIVK